MVPGKDAVRSGGSGPASVGGGEAMPGRLIMDQHSVPASQDLKKGRSQAQQGHQSQKRDFAQMQSPPHSNGSGNHASKASLPNGAPVQPPATTNGQADPGDAAASLPTPPPLDGSWRETDSNKSLGLLVDRLAQQCFGDLTETLTKMAEIPAPPAGQPNGVVPHAVDTNDGSLNRKRALMDFAHNQRDRFTKTLVLSDWARRGDDMARLIDLKVWQSRQADYQRHAINFFYSLRQDMRNAKMPNPNIEGALELLSSGKAGKFPDLGYLPPKRLSAKQLLKTLRGMNVTLITRLNLQDDLPPHFNDYSVANGRATFRVPGEFEVDVSVADEDPATPFYFIDIRFLFSPTPSLSDDGLRVRLEEMANAALGKGGLQGCYDFLHGYVLAHKVNLLRSQAAKLLREKWFDCLQPEMHRQVLTLQYWKGQRTPKSWIEVGVTSGKQKGVGSRKPSTSRNSFRWFRQGQEVKSHGIEINWSELNLESILASVTAKHAEWALRSMKERCEALAGPDSRVQIQLTTSGDSPEGCYLTLSLPGLRRPITTRLEPVTGQFSISPPTRNAQLAEKFINSNANADPARSLAEVLTRSIQDKITPIANTAGWVPVDLSKVMIQPSLKTIFGTDAIRRSLYKPSEGWGDSWALHVTFGLSGVKWFVVRLEEKVDQGRSFRVMTHANLLSLADTNAEITQASLLRVQNVAEAEISFTVLAQELADSDHEYRIESTSPLTRKSAAVDPGLAIYFSATPRKRTGSKAPVKTFPWASWIKLTPSSPAVSDNGFAEVQHELRLSADPSGLQHLLEHVTKRPRGTEIVMNESGALGLRLHAPFGQPFLANIIGLLARCHRLNQSLGLLKHFGCRCTDLGLNKIAFDYAESPTLAAEIHFGKTSAVPCKLKLTPIESNPHQRLRVLLEKAYNRPSVGNTALNRLVLDLRATLPLMSSLEKLEFAESSRHSVMVHPRQVHNFVLSYQEPFAVCRFSITMHKHEEQPSGRTRYGFRCKLESDSDAALSEALRTLSKTTGEGWLGDQSGGFGADAKGLDDALTKFDEVVRNFVPSANGDQIKKQETPAPHVKRNNSPAPPIKPPTAHRNQQRPAAQQRQHSRHSVKQEIIELD